jgi:hypothetical protein
MIKTDFGQDTLFGKKVISTIGYNEQEIIRDILYLHADNKPIDCDPTYSTGHFYKDWAQPPKYKFDKFPQSPGTVEATSDKLPLDQNSVSVIMFDPPFVMEGEHSNEAQNGSCITGKRFSSFRNFEELKEMYSLSLKEFSRVLYNKGIVIFKCQDVVVCGLNHFTHSWLMFEAIKYGFYPKDLFILLAKNRLNDGRVQQHARKYHCYFWVFKKEICKINYLTPKE